MPETCHSLGEGIPFDYQLVHSLVNRQSHQGFTRLWREVLVVLNTTTTRINGVIVVYLRGGIFFGEESAFLQPLVKDLLNESRKIVFDLGNVTHLDSGGVGILVAVFASARKVGGEIRFANLGNHTNEVFHTTNLVTVFEIFRNTRDAIASFNRDTNGYSRITNA